MTGFYVYQANLGTETLTGTTTDPFSIATLPLPLATYITGFMVQGSGSTANTIATAPSGALLAVPAPLIGHGLLVLLAVGGVLFGGTLFESLKMRRSLAA